MGWWGELSGGGSGVEGRRKIAACVRASRKIAGGRREREIWIYKWGGGLSYIFGPAALIKQTRRSLGVLLRVLDVGPADGCAVVAQVARGVCCCWAGRGEGRGREKGWSERAVLGRRRRARSSSSSRGRSRAGPRAPADRTPPSLTAVKAGCSGVPNTMCMKSAVASQAAVHMGARARGFDWGGGRGHERDMHGKRSA